MIGDRISHYKITAKVGEGGMGIVYRAEDSKLGRQVALKFLPEEMLKNKLALERFLREARTAAAISHPHICTIYEIGEHEGRPFIAMEYLEGEPLSSRIEKSALPVDMVLEIGAANGARLAKISERFEARAVAVEPSAEAIQDGRVRFPDVKFVKAKASAIPLQEMFDLIIINFVLHWVDRRNLLRSMAEIDRLLKDGGYLIIGDFLPSNLTKVRYHHVKNQEIYTYKQNYAATFLASGPQFLL